MSSSAAPAPAAATSAAPAASGQHTHSSNNSQSHSHSHNDAHGKPHVSWDEETIAEHDLLRGTRQKIEEPNTPYHYYDHEADDAGVVKSPVSPARSLSGKEGEPPTIEWNELRSKLQNVQQDHTHTSEWDSSDDEGKRSPAGFAARDAEGKKIAKDPQFATKRKSHYNEFERVKAWRQAHANDDDDDDEAADGTSAAAASKTWAS